jgi:arylsulfatase A-like enzyme
MFNHLCVLVGLGFALAANGAETRPVRPNLVLILADDLGFSDLGCYGGEISTPTLDALAARGLRYTQFYNAARCCPSRASLLTGLSPHRAGIGHMTEDHHLPGYRGDLATNTVTVAEALRAAGYRTGMTGKWHLTWNLTADGPRENWPLQRGFEKFYGTLPSHGSQFDPAGLFDGNTPVKADGDFFYTDAITEHAIRFIREFEKSGAPFFLYVAYTAPHYPIQARAETIHRYRGKYAQGWEKLRAERFERAMKIGVIPKSARLPKRDDQCPDWSKESHPDWQQNRMEVYAAMVEEMDRGIGRIVEALRASGALDNTLIVFLSDNGASAEGHLNNTIERNGKPWNDRWAPLTNRAGQRVVAGDIPGVPLGGDTSYGSYGAAWAHVSNSPFQRYKSWLHEGGIATPMIAHWPHGITEHGGLRTRVSEIRDLMPTFLELAGASYPEQIRKQATPPMEGRSLVASFAKDEPASDRILCWEHEGNRAVRQGQWKLVSEYPGGWSALRRYPNRGEWELYNLEADRTETKNVASEHPAVVQRLAAEWQRWAERSQVRDWKEIGGESW